jgi:hypothetical protein
LRNRIYEYIINPGSLRLKQVRHRGAKAQPHPDWHNYHLADFALTQVCREIRAEYLPIYQTRHEVHVKHYNAEAYCASRVFYPGIKPEHAIGNLVIYYEAPTPRKHCYPRNILCLVRQVAAAPQFKLRIRMLDFQIHNLRLCLYSLTIHASSEPALAAYLDKAVSAIEFGSSTVCQGFQLCIHIKLDFWEYWMVDCMIDDTRAGEEHEDELSAGMSDLSLDINLRRFIIFRPSR